ncbi:MAG: hypothetical protein HRU80_07045 [Ignavibacteriales bacterium]|nr:hypothetical protein [Ignavibacteriaceae bacterium]QOJ28645.1 MAG: hypothetical protein HRU80_07045 [Ignavibacteriales bacterium]
MKKNIYLILILLFAGNQISAQGLSDGLRLSAFGTNSGVRALGMGNSYTALSDDGTGMFYNPAGIGLVKKLEFTGNLDYFSYNNDVTFLGNKSKYNNSATNLSSLSFIFPFPTLRGSFVVGAGYSTSHLYTGGLSFDGFNPGSSLIADLAIDTDVPYDLFMTDEDGNTILNSNLNQSGNTLESGSLENYAFTAGVEVYKDIFVGGTLNISSGTYKNSRDFYEDDTRGFYDTTIVAPGYTFTRDFETFFLNRTLDWEMQGWDFKLGVLYQINKMARFGLKIQFPKYYTVKEKFYASGYSDWGNGTRRTLDEADYEFSTEYDITTPFEFSVGGAVNLTGLILSGEVTLTDYTQMEFSNGIGISEAELVNINKRAKELLTAVMNYNVGAEYLIPTTNFRIRGGYFVQKSPYDGDDAAYDRKYVTLGGGFLVDGIISLDLAFVRGFYDNFGDNYGSNLSRTQQSITTNRLMLSFGYRF